MPRSTEQASIIGYGFTAARAWECLDMSWCHNAGRPTVLERLEFPTPLTPSTRVHINRSCIVIYYYCYTDPRFGLLFAAGENNTIHGWHIYCCVLPVAHASLFRESIVFIQVYIKIHEVRRQPMHINVTCNVCPQQRQLIYLNEPNNVCWLL